jgi:outer membrane protein OmpU
MNKLTKIGVSALAGSLALTAAHAADASLSGSVAVYVTNVDEGKGGASFFQGDSLTASVSGETDGGITASASWEFDSGAPSTSSYDNRTLSFGNDTIGTFTFAGHGGTTVMGGWDDVMPTAYEEPWDITSGASAARINGVNGENVWKYTSPTTAGVKVLIGHQYLNQGTAGTANDVTVDSYTDFGIQIDPEMVEGLSIGYATGELADTATTTIDHSTIWVKYAIGSVTVGYQEHEADGPTATKTDESQSYAVSYAVNDDFSISYGEREYNSGDSTTDQDDTAISASYTMGGMTIAGGFNSSDNIAGSTAASSDKDSYEIGLSFAF